MAVKSADGLCVYRDLEASVVILEYEVHGESVQTGRPYNNRFVSIVTIGDGKVTRWRDYLDPVAVFDAAGWLVVQAAIISRTAAVDKAFISHDCRTALLYAEQAQLQSPRLDGGQVTRTERLTPASTGRALLWHLPGILRCGLHITCVCELAELGDLEMATTL